MACETTSITQDLLASYEELGGINHLDGANLPSKCAIASLCSDLLQLLFPGFFEAEAIHREEVEARTKQRIADVMARLEVEIRPSLASQKNPPADVPGEAHRSACHFLRSLPRVRELLKTDVQAAFDGDPAAGSYDEVILAYPGLEAIAIQRLAHVLYESGVPLIPRMMTEWTHSKTGIDIHPGAEIGEYFFIDHGTGVVVGETARLGHHVKLYQGVGLVARSLAAGQMLKGRRRHPCIEDYVTLYANASIVGDITIGRGSTIGANVFLTESVPPDSVVALGEQKNEVKPRRRSVPAA
ncbi:MAG TPA: serine O-acetyltransferase EpsC [Verrucomicrobiales bacterium]|nr:serine O-acetyltransferase EpsC [Verrucomicrobiales bacterium]